MSFELKKEGAIDQKLVNTMPVDKLDKSMEVYIHDIAVKAGKDKSHLDDLQDLFTKLAEHKIRLN